MGKFQFSLESVLNYKDQILEVLQGEYAILLSQVREQEEIVNSLRRNYYISNEEYCVRKKEGISILDATRYECEFRAMESEMRCQEKLLDDLKVLAEKKRGEIVEAKKETASLEKLKEKKQNEYQKSEQKAEELMIDEFVNSTRAHAASA
jgi:flagellar FliJ protein